MSEHNSISAILANREKIVQNWDWWSSFLQREYYGGRSEVMNWNVAERSLVADLGLQPGMSVLDLGSGSGELEFRLGQRGMNVVGVEHSESLVQECQRIARDKGIPATFVAANMFTYRPQEQFNAILSVNTSFGYGSNQENRQLIHNIAQWLKPGGALYLDLLVADNATPFGTWNDDLADGILVVHNTWEPEHSTMVSLPYWIPPNDNTTILAAPNPERVRLYSISQLEELFQEAGLQSSPVVNGLGRRMRQEGQNIMRTWIARKKV